VEDEERDGVQDEGKGDRMGERGLNSRGRWREWWGKAEGKG
jgi:hypothetical protein